MICDDIRDLVPAYALGVTTDDEARQVDDHIASCREHDLDIEDARGTAELLAAGVPAMEPPADLKARILAQALAGEVGSAVAPAGPGVGQAVGGQGTGRGWMRWLQGASLKAHPLAAVFVLIIGGLLVWNVMLQTEDQPERFTHYYWGNDADWLRLETVLGKPGAEVSLGGIDRLDESQLYYLWDTREDSTLLVGMFNVSPEGRWAGEFDFTFREGDRLWITVEDAAGTTEPTGDPVIRTRF